MGKQTKNETPSISIMESFSRLFQASDSMQYKRLICRDVEFEKKQRRTMRHDYAKSKSGVWGPTHSHDSDEKSTEEESYSIEGGGRNMNVSQNSAQTPVASSPHTPPKAPQTPKIPPKSTSIFQGILSCASEAWNDYLNTSAEGGMCTPCNQCRGDSPGQKSATKSPVNPNNATEPMNDHANDNGNANGTAKYNSDAVPIKKTRSHASSLTSGIARLTLGHSPSIVGKGTNKTKSVCDDEEAQVAAKKMASATSADKNQKSNYPLPTEPSPPTAITPGKSIGKSTGKSAAQNVPNHNAQAQRHHKRDPPPFSHITVDSSTNFSRSISELTMRSSFGEVTEKISDCRRMAYYAVGKNHGNGKKSPNGGGNRRCYFTGDLIRGGQPFYAGSVQQGLRTLVVFCLPSALDLPRRDDLERLTIMNLNEYDDDDDEKDAAVIKKSLSNISRHSGKSRKSTKSALSRMSSIWSDGAAMESYHTEWTEDEHGNLCDMIKPELLLQALPEPNKELMDEIEGRFPDQFATLPKQVRCHQCWRLYLKFCFFSGLPIADGEMYYKVSDKITMKLSRKLYKAGIDEIILSHEVMEAVNGQSAEILRLPNKKTFRYLQKHYTQQCAKLSNRVFDRTSWEMVMPEV